MKRRLLLILTSVFICLSVYAGMNEENNALLDTLRMSLNNLDRNQSELQGHLESLRSRYRQAAGPERISLGDELGRKYIVVDIDSAIKYLNATMLQAEAMGNTLVQTKEKLQLLAVLPIKGMTREAIEYFEKINPDSLPAEIRDVYWRSASELYHTAQLPYPEGPFKEYYRHKSLEAIDSLLAYYPENSPVHQYILGHSYLLKGQLNLAVAKFVEVIPDLKDNPELADFAMRMISMYYQGRPEYRQVYINYLIRRAIKAVDRGLIKPDLMAQLGGELMESGYNELGRRCISVALETSDKSYAGPYRTFDRARYVRYLTDDDESRRNTLVFFICIVVIMGVIGCYIVVRLRIALKDSRLQNSEVIATLEKQRRQSLLTDNCVLNLAFVALDQLKEYNLHVMRKLKAGQSKELVAEADSGKYIQRQTEKYFEVFDAGFLSSFPEFVDKLNSLLQADRRLALLSGDRLSPELRIAAFMWLGVTDSNRLAQVLGLSLNTIYTYRNRLKGRAIDRENFEQNLRNLL